MNIVYISESELEQLGYTKEYNPMSIVWIIAGNRYLCKEATATGYYFVKID